MPDSWLFTSESVSEGHPDKICDQISDAVLDAVLAHDPQGRVACEVLVKNNLVVIAGEITAAVEPDYDALAREVIREIGYTDEMGFGPDSCTIVTQVGRQSPEIRHAVDGDLRGNLCAGDQGIMFGYATRETDVLMPLPITLAHRLVRRQAELRKSGGLSWLRPDAKSQVTVRYVDGVPAAIRTVVLSTQHHPDIDLKTLREAVIEEIIKPVLPPGLASGAVEYIVNPGGSFVTGGPVGDAGMTGRKIIVDTYGGMARHGGGAFSGKDPVEGGPFGGIRLPARGQERRGRRARRPMRDPGVVRDRPGGTGVCTGRNVRHQRHVRTRDREGSSATFRSDAARDHRRARSPQTDLQDNRLLRPFRTGGAGFHVGGYGDRTRTGPVNEAP